MLTSFDPRQEPLLREHRAGAQLEIGNPPRHGQLVERRLAQPQIVCSLVEPEQLLGGRGAVLAGGSCFAGGSLGAVSRSASWMSRWIACSAVMRCRTTIEIVVVVVIDP